MQQWVADAQADGLQVNYLPTGSPQGLSQFADSLVDFAGTEAEYSALGFGDGRVARLPVRAGRRRRCGHHVQRPGQGRAQGRLPPPVAARPSPASSSATSATGRTRPSPPTTRVWCCPTSRSTSCTAAASPAPLPSSTTSSSTTVPDKFSAWADKNQLPTKVRIVQLDSAPELRPEDAGPQRLGPDRPVRGQQRRARGRSPTTSSATPSPTALTAAWVQNQSGQYQLPVRREHLRRPRVGQAPRPTSART